MQEQKVVKTNKKSFFLHHEIIVLHIIFRRYL